MPELDLPMKTILAALGLFICGLGCKTETQNKAGVSFLGTYTFSPPTLAGATCGASGCPPNLGTGNPVYVVAEVNGELVATTANGNKFPLTTSDTSVSGKVEEPVTSGDCTGTITATFTLTPQTSTALGSIDVSTMGSCGGGAVQTCGCFYTMAGARQ